MFALLVGSDAAHPPLTHIRECQFWPHSSTIMNFLNSILPSCSRGWPNESCLIQISRHLWRVEWYILAHGTVWYNPGLCLNGGKCLISPKVSIKRKLCSGNFLRFFFLWLEIAVSSATPYRAGLNNRLSREEPETPPIPWIFTELSLAEPGGGIFRVQTIFLRIFSLIPVRVEG